jgi:hypothetical protein
VEILSDFVANHQDLRVVEEACICIGNLGCSSAEFCKIAGAQKGFFKRLVSLISTKRTTEGDGHDDESKSNDPEAAEEAAAAHEVFAHTLANGTEQQPENAKAMFDAGGLVAIVQILRAWAQLPAFELHGYSGGNHQRRTKTSRHTSKAINDGEFLEMEHVVKIDPEQAAHAERFGTFSGDEYEQASEALSAALAHCVQLNTDACETLASLPHDAGLTLCISLLSQNLLSLQRCGVALLAEVCTCGTKPQLRDYVCTRLRDRELDALVPLCWMADHKVHGVRVDARRCLDALRAHHVDPAAAHAPNQDPTATSGKEQLEMFIEQGCIPVLHQLTASTNSGSATFAIRFLESCNESFTLDFLNDELDKLRHAADPSHESYDVDIAGHIASAVIHLCFGAPVPVREHFIGGPSATTHATGGGGGGGGAKTKAEEAGLDKVLDMLLNADTRGTALDMLYAVESLLPQPPGPETEIVGDDDAVGQAAIADLERLCKEVAGVTINGEELKESHFNNSHAHPDICFRLGPKRQVVWAHKCVVAASGSPLLASMIRRVNAASKEIAIDAPKAIAHVDPDEYVAAFTTLLWYLYFPDANESMLSATVTKYPQIPKVLLQITLHHDEPGLRLRICGHLRKLMNEDNVVQFLIAGVETCANVHEDEKEHVPGAKAPIDPAVAALRNAAFVLALEAFMPLVRKSEGNEAVQELIPLFRSFVEQVLA